MKPIEKWRDVEGYEGMYQVSTEGRVKSYQRGKERILNYNIRADRRCSVQLYKESKGHRLFVARLVAAAFLPNPESKPEVNHIDLDPTNNRVTNLEWATREENQKHANINKAQLRGSQCHTSIYTEEDVLDIYRSLDRGESVRSIAGRYNSSYHGVYHISKGTTWKHLYDIWKRGDIND